MEDLIKVPKANCMEEKAQGFWTNVITGDQFFLFLFFFLTIKILGVSCTLQNLRKINLATVWGEWVKIQQDYNRKLSRWWSK